MDIVENYYNDDPESEWNRLARHRTEMDITLRALAEFLPPAPARLIDIGGGPGRYAIRLSQMGYSVTLLDLAEGNLKVARAQAEAAGVQLEEVAQANALDLSAYADDSFDAALLMGPLYHLLEAEERLNAVREVVRVVKPGGRVFASFINRHGVFRDATVNGMAWVVSDLAYAWRMMETGRHDNGDGFTRAYFAHPAEIAPLMLAGGLQMVMMLACEGVVVDGMEEKVNQLGEADWKAWQDLNYAMAKDPTALGAACHILHIGQKR